MESAWKAGIVVVTAAGNWGRDNSMHTHGFATIGAPGNDPVVLTVGATRTRGTDDRSDDIIASYSSKGPTLLDHVVKPDSGCARKPPGVSASSQTARWTRTYPSYQVKRQQR